MRCYSFAYSMCLMIVNAIVRGGLETVRSRHAALRLPRWPPTWTIIIISCSSSITVHFGTSFAPLCAMLRVAAPPALPGVGARSPCNMIVYIYIYIYIIHVLLVVVIAVVVVVVIVVVVVHMYIYVCIIRYCVFSFCLSRALRRAVARLT